MSATTIKIGSTIVARIIGEERVEGIVENIEITDGGKYGTPVESAVVGQDEIVVDIPGRFIYGYQLTYVDGTWVGA